MAEKGRCIRRPGKGRGVEGEKAPALVAVAGGVAIPEQRQSYNKRRRSRGPSARHEFPLGEGQGKRGENLAVSGCAALSPREPYPTPWRTRAAKQLAAGTPTRRGSPVSAGTLPREVSARRTGKPRSPEARASRSSLVSWRPPFALGEGQVGTERATGRVGVTDPYPRAASSYAAVNCSVSSSS